MQMLNFKRSILLVLLLVFIVLAYLKPSKQQVFYTSYFQQLNAALQQSNKSASCAIIDIDSLDNNIKAVQQQLGDKFHLRLVTKSLPSFALLDYLMLHTQSNKLMVFSEPFIDAVLTKYDADSLDILLGKPLPIDAIKRLAAKHQKWNTFHYLVDTEKRLHEYIEFAKQQHTNIHLALEINVGLQRGGFDSPEKLAVAVKYIKANQNIVQCSGLMGYDGHVPYVPFYINKENEIKKSFTKTQETYNAFVKVLFQSYSKAEVSKMILNSGGSRTYFYYKNYTDTMSVNDIAIGSAFLAPSSFPELTTHGHHAALYLASPILKKIPSSQLPNAVALSPFINWWNPNLKVSYFMIGGGWPGNIVAPNGIQKNSFWEKEGKGYTNLLPNQSILSSSIDNHLQVDDFVFSQAWEGDGMLCFSKVLLYKKKKIIGNWLTYTGAN